MSNQRISELTAKSNQLSNTDLIEVSVYNGTTYDTKRVTGSEIRRTKIATKTANYTLVLDDANITILMNKATSGTLTVPANSTVAFDVGTKIDVITINNDITIMETVGGSINSLAGNMKISGTYGKCQLLNIGTDNWILTGDLTT